MEKVKTTFEHYPIGADCYVIEYSQESKITLVKGKIEEINLIAYPKISYKVRYKKHLRLLAYENEVYLNIEDAISYLHLEIDKLKDIIVE